LAFWLWGLWHRPHKALDAGCWSCRPAPDAVRSGPALRVPGLIRKNFKEFFCDAINRSIAWFQAHPVPHSLPPSPACWKVCVPESRESHPRCVLPGKPAVRLLWVSEERFRV
jgi:hypothetical protein